MSMSPATPVTPTFTSLIPWRTLTGRQSLYQDHQWMRDFGESLLVYRPPIDTRSVKAVMGEKSNGNPEKALNFLTPHQKWGIHSTYSDNLLMLTLVARWAYCLDERSGCERSGYRR